MEPTVHLPSAYNEYGRITKQDSPPLVLKAAFGYPTGRKIRNSRRNSPPYFHHELYGEICIWKEALRRGSPHTELFAPIYQCDNSDYEWAIVGYATNVLDRTSRLAAQLEEQAEGLGWAADDTEVGTFEGRTVAVDYGGWWRHDDDWLTGVHEQPIYEDEFYDPSVSVHTIPNTATFSDPVEDSSESNLARFRQWVLSHFP